MHLFKVTNKEVKFVQDDQQNDKIGYTLVIRLTKKNGDWKNWLTLFLFVNPFLDKTFTNQIPKFQMKGGGLKTTPISMKFNRLLFLLNTTTN